MPIGITVLQNQLEQGTTNSVRMNALQRGRITIGVRLGEKSLGIIAASSQHSTPLCKGPVLGTSVLGPVTFSAVQISGVLSRKVGTVAVIGGITVVDP